jgi:hypothetical protein
MSSDHYQTFRTTPKVDRELSDDVSLAVSKRVLRTLRRKRDQSKRIKP